MKNLPILLLLLLSSFGMRMQSQESSITVSLITCYPGPEVYELYGHTAIRIVDGNTDIAYNFGMFSFNKPNFIYRFVKGETDYALGQYPFSYFLPDYIARGSKVVEQILDLSPEQAKSLQMRLNWQSLPQNREYRYNYVLDNCATRPRDMIEQAVGELDYATPADTTLTFRNIMREYSKNYPWYQFGIDLALGSGIDRKISTREQMFAPIYLMNALQTATYTTPDGKQRPIVKDTNILYEGTDSSILGPTPWYASPLSISLFLLVTICYASWRDVRRGVSSRWLNSIWFAATGLAGCLLFFLIFISEHEAVSPNYLAFWLNPFCLFPAIAVWIKSCRRYLYFYHFINFALVLILMACWKMLPQCANIAFFPLMLCTVVLSASNVVIYRKCAKRNK